MKIVLDIETVQPSREEWARLTGKPATTELLSSEECMDLFSASAADEQRRADDELYAMPRRPGSTRSASRAA